jgi:hypothetical protein
MHFPDAGCYPLLCCLVVQIVIFNSRYVEISGMKIEQIKTLVESKPVFVKRPLNYNSYDERWFLPWENYFTNDQEIYMLNDAKVTDKGVVFGLLRKFDKGLVSPKLIKQFNSFYILKVNLAYKKIRTDDEKVYIIAFDPWSARNYYHWVIDTLPRLHIVRDKLPHSVLLLPRNARRYMYESAQLFNPKEILELKKHSFACVKNLCLPRPVADSGRHDGMALLGVKNFILSRLGEPNDTASSGEKVYVSRASQSARKIHNEHEVLDLLRNYGFSIVHFENMPFSEQVTVMRKAKYVVSSHGANLTNMLFMPERGKVLEINKEDSPNLCYYSLASSINLDYFYQLCPTACDGPDIDNNADLMVNIGKLRENVEMMLLH